MSRNTCTRDLTKVQTNIEALRFNCFCQSLAPHRQLLLEFKQYRCISFQQRCVMLKGCNEEMTVGVGIPIQNHDALVRTF